jgi:sugar/nucleoside kinase (ribokinase family)
MSLLVVGSIALDTVKTPVEEHSDLLGGSASYAAAAASYFSPVKLIGVVGSDFPDSEFKFWKQRNIDSEGVQRVNGKTFRWSGEYSWDLNTRETRSVALNVFENFKPELPKSYRQTDFALLANIAPALQSHVLKQMEKPRFVVADTMDLWIETTRADLDALLPQVDLLILNDSEAREMTKETSLIKAGRAISKWVRAMSRSKKASTARFFLAKTNSSAAARIRSRTFTIRPEQGTRSPAGWPVIWREQSKR